MSEKNQNEKSLSDTNQPLKSGEEPTELLLALAWSPLETLIRRGVVSVYVGNGAIAMFLHGVEIAPHLGLVPTDKSSVGSDATE